MKPDLGKKFENTYRDSLFAKREEQWKHVPYDAELVLMDIVRKGDLEALERVMPGYFPEHDAHLSKDPVRQRKYEFVALITLVTRFAVEGGLDAETAYGLSDAYIQTVDEAKSKQEVYAISDKMLPDFITRVRDAKARPTLSKPITNCLKYIDANLHYTITLASLSAFVQLTPAYISTRFKKEVGLSVSEYILKQRIEEAKSILVHTDIPIAEIANTLAFNSQSYFSAVFRRSEGMTPKEYKTQYFREYQRHRKQPSRVG